jgi:hypothetical protein
MNTWQPGADINFAKIGPKERPQTQKKLAGHSTKKGTDESRIDEARWLLSRQRDQVSQNGKQTANAKDKAVAKPDESGYKTAGERKRRSLMSARQLQSAAR